MYQRQDEGTCVVVAGCAENSKRVDEVYPQTVIRQKLMMKSRGVLNGKALRDYYRISWVLRGIVKQYQPRIMHAARPLNEGLACRLTSMLTGVPYACYVHGEDVNVAKTSRDLTFATRFAIKGAVALIANSTFTKQLLIDDWGVSPDRIVLMHPGVDTKRFANANVAVEGSKSLNLLTAGRLQKRKGHDVVIQALLELMKLFPEVSYTVAGSGEELSSLQSLAKSLGVDDRVRFAGEVDDQQLVTLYHECDIFVLANRAVGQDVEGFGIVLLEAQASGKPVIAGRSGGTADTMVEGQTGFLIDATTPDELIQCVRENLATAGQREAMGQAAVRHVQSNFDWEQLGKQAKSRFEEILAKC
ncbi:glycosyltransferase family 4 protein [Stieleria sp. JC731]|nr:glycosyltransferase family 4 protein [Stieleria sp. JC731]